MSIPSWAKKPKVKDGQEVVATDKGWVMKATGEMLKRANNLRVRLFMLKQEVLDSVSYVDDIDNGTFTGHDTNNAKVEKVIDNMEKVVETALQGAKTTPPVTDIADDPYKGESPTQVRINEVKALLDEFNRSGEGLQYKSETDTKKSEDDTDRPTKTPEGSNLGDLLNDINKVDSLEKEEKPKAKRGPKPGTKRTKKTNDSNGTDV